MLRAPVLHALVLLGTTTGTFHYHCSIHPPSRFPSFRGTITVTQ